MTQLMCGAAIRDITPPEELLHGLRGLMGIKYGGIHDELKVRAVAFSNGDERALIIQADTDKDQSPVRELKYIEDRWGIKEENVLYFGIHTHAAPMHTGRPELERPLTDEDREEVHTCTKAYEELFFSRMHEAIDEALSTMRPCKIGCGKTEEYSNTRRVQDYVFYGDNGVEEKRVALEGAEPGDKISREFFLMRVNDMEDKPIAFLINYPMHCVTMFLNHLAPDGTNLISGDVAGNLSQVMEKRFPGAVAVWSSGAAGDVNPLPNAFAGYVDPLTNERKRFQVANPNDLMEYLTARHFAAAMRAMADIHYYSTNAEIKGAVELSQTPKRAVKIDDPMDTSSSVEETFDIRLQTLRIGDVLLIGVGGELFNGFAEELKSVSPLRNTVVINHNLSLIHLCGYIYDDNALSRGYGIRPGMASQIAPGYISDSLKSHFYNMMNN